MHAASKAKIKSSFCVVARNLTEKRRFEQQNTVKIKCSQLSCDQPQKEDLIAALVVQIRLLIYRVPNNKPVFLILSL